LKNKKHDIMDSQDFKASLRANPIQDDKEVLAETVTEKETT